MILTIDRLGHRGDGIAPGPVYVPITLPGEVVEGDVQGDRMEAPRIVTASSDRVSPPCRHFKSCGGCTLQHAKDAYLETWKADQVRIALAAHGLDAPINGVSTSPPKSRRRAVFSGRRTKKGALVGFHARASDVIVEVPDCQLVVPELAACLPGLTEITALGASRKGEVTLTATWSEAGADIAIMGGKPLDGPMRTDLAGIAARHEFARLVWDEELIAERHPPVQDFGGISVTPPPGAFLQATKHGEAALFGAVTRAVGPAKRILDLFAGCGTFALPLARQAELHAAEGGAAMTKALDQGWRHAKGLKRITTETRDLFRLPLLAAELRGFDAVVIDPPRAGAEAQMKELAKARIPRIAAVSCNPVSFARDAKTLTNGGFRLDWIEVVDQFRWSADVELAAQFSHAHMQADDALEGRQGMKRKNIAAWLDQDKVRNAIIGVIVFNAILLGLETSNAAMARAGTLIVALDKVCLSIFVIEISLKLYAHGLSFFKRGWNNFDFVIVGVSLIPGAQTLSVLRALRILRLLRVISVAPRLRRVVEGFVNALPGMGSVFFLMAMIFYIGSVMATKLFGVDCPGCTPGQAAQMQEWFGTLGRSAYSLFQIMTLESWSMGIVRPVMEIWPYAWAFFVPFIMVTTFAVVNLLVGLIVNSMQDAHHQEDVAATGTYRDEVLARLTAIEEQLKTRESDPHPYSEIKVICL